MSVTRPASVTQPVALEQPAGTIDDESIPEQEPGPYAMGLAGPEWTVLPPGFGRATSDDRLLPQLFRGPVASLEELQAASTWNPEGRSFDPEVLERHRRKFEVLAAAVAPSLAAIDRQTVPSLLKAKFEGVTVRSWWKGLQQVAIDAGADPEDPNLISREAYPICGNTTLEERMKLRYGRVRHVTSGEAASAEKMPELAQLVKYHHALCLELSDVVVALYRESGIWDEDQAKWNQMYLRIGAAGPF